MSKGQARSNRADPRDSDLVKFPPTQLGHDKRVSSIALRPLDLPYGGIWRLELMRAEIRGRSPRSPVNVGRHCG